MFAQAWEKARQSSCRAGMKQVGLAFIQYVSDYDQRLFDIDWGATAEPYWKILNPYIKNEQLWACPSMAADNCRPHCWAPYNVRDRDIPGDNRMWSEHCMSNGYNEADITNPAPANWLILSEGGCAVNGWTWANLTPVGCDRRRETANKHGGGRNCLFYDGHCKWDKDENMGNYDSDPTG